MDRRMLIIYSRVCAFVLASMIAIAATISQIYTLIHLLFY